MGKQYLLGYDIGTSGSKGVVIDFDGHVIAHASREHGIEIPRPAWAEQDADKLYWNEFQSIVRELLSNLDPGDIAAVGISGLSPDVICVDKNKNAIRKCIMYMDRRATAECQWCRDHIGEEELLAASGNVIDPFFAGYECIWVARNEPDIYERTWKFITAHAYVVLKLTGEAVIDYGVAGLYAPFFDQIHYCWNEDMIARCGLSVDKFPSPRTAVEVVGAVTREAMEACGLMEGTPIIAGGGVDASCSGLSVGMVDAKDSACMCGTTHCWQVVLYKPQFDRHLITYPHVVPGRWITYAGLGTSGGVVKWFRDNFGDAELEYQRKRGVSAYELLNLEAERTPKGADGLIVLPYFMGERSPIWDPFARGTFFGLSLYHNRGHMFRAIIEGIALALEHHAVYLRERGQMPKRIVAVDGGAASNLERQAMADVLKVPIDYMSKAGGAPLADAFLAGVGIGVYSDYHKIQEWCRYDVTNYPDPTAAETYEKLYKVYVDLYLNTREQMHALARLNDKPN